MKEYVIASVCHLKDRTVYIIEDITSTSEDALEKLSDIMSGKWGYNETFVILKVLTQHITTIFSNDIPSHEEYLKRKKEEKIRDKVDAERSK